MKVNYNPPQTIHTKKNLSVLLLLPYYYYVETYTYTLQKGEFYMEHLVLETIEAYQYYPIHMVPPITIHHHHIITYPLPHIILYRTKKIIINEIIYA